MTVKATSTRFARAEPGPMESAMHNMQTAGMQTLSFLGAAWMRQVQGFGSEVAQFVAERLQEDLKLQHQLMHSKDPRAWQEAQAEFLRTALEQYTAETGKLASISGEIIGEAFGPKRPH